jgi:hypothetical protein
LFENCLGLDKDMLEICWRLVRELFKTCSRFVEDF